MSNAVRYFLRSDRGPSHISAELPTPHIGAGSVDGVRRSCCCLAAPGEATEAFAGTPAKGSYSSPSTSGVRESNDKKRDAALEGVAVEEHQGSAETSQAPISRYAVRRRVLRFSHKALTTGVALKMFRQVRIGNQASVVRSVVAVLAAMLVGGISGCASFNSAISETKQVVEYYRIFSVPPGTGRDKIISAARLGLTQNAGNIQDARPIPPAQLPATPGRFQPVSLFAQGSAFAAFAGAAAQSLKGADCTGSIWTANATRTIGNDMARIYVCLWEYTGGYHLDVYTSYMKTEGGVSVTRLAKAVVNPLVGTFEQALEKTVNDMARQVQDAATGPIRYVEGYPEPIDEPWWSKGTSIAGH